MRAVTLSLQLLLLLPPPRVMIIFCQLFCHGLGIEAKSQGPGTKDVLLLQTPPHPQIKDEVSPAARGTG
jgi:hypothetical protein